jgi:putative membrane protein
MKNLSIFILSSVMFYSCSSNNTNNEQAESDKQEAEKRNEAKFSKDAEDDAQFVVDAANMNLTEMSLGSIASRSGATKEIKELGNTLNTAHRNSYDELSEYARKNSISIPSTIGEPASRDSVDFAGIKGNDFNERYINKMVSTHKDAIELFEKGANNCKDPELVAWINSQLPELRKHLDVAMDAQNKIAKK